MQQRGRQLCDRLIHGCFHIDLPVQARGAYLLPQCGVAQQTEVRPEDPGRVVTHRLLHPCLQACQLILNTRDGALQLRQLCCQLVRVDRPTRHCNPLATRANNGRPTRQARGRCFSQQHD